MFAINHYLIYFATPPVSTPVRRYPVSSNASLLLFYFLDNVGCNGSEARLSECEHNEVGDHNCHIRYDQAGVKCNSEKVSPFLHIIYSSGLLYSSHFRTGMQ